MLKAAGVGETIYITALLLTHLPGSAHSDMQCFRTCNCYRWRHWCKSRSDLGMGATNFLLPCWAGTERSKVSPGAVSLILCISGMKLARFADKIGALARWSPPGCLHVSHISCVQCIFHFQLPRPKGSWSPCTLAILRATARKSGLLGPLRHQPGVDQTVKRKQVWEEKGWEEHAGDGKEGNFSHSQYVQLHLTPDECILLVDQQEPLLH